MSDFNNEVNFSRVLPNMKLIPSSSSPNDCKELETFAKKYEKNVNLLARECITWLSCNPYKNERIYYKETKKSGDVTEKQFDNTAAKKKLRKRIKTRKISNADKDVLLCFMAMFVIKMKSTRTKAPLLNKHRENTTTLTKNDVETLHNICKNGITLKDQDHAKLFFKCCNFLHSAKFFDCQPFKSFKTFESANPFASLLEEVVGKLKSWRTWNEKAAEEKEDLRRDAETIFNKYTTDEIKELDAFRKFCKKFNIINEFKNHTKNHILNCILPSIHQGNSKLPKSFIIIKRKDKNGNIKEKKDLYDGLAVEFYDYLKSHPRLIEHNEKYKSKYESINKSKYGSCLLAVSFDYLNKMIEYERKKDYAICSFLNNNIKNVGISLGSNFLPFKLRCLGDDYSYKNETYKYVEFKNIKEKQKTNTRRVNTLFIEINFNGKIYEYFCPLYSPKNKGKEYFNDLMVSEIAGGSYVFDFKKNGFYDVSGKVSQPKIKFKNNRVILDLTYSLQNDDSLRKLYYEYAPYFKSSMLYKENGEISDVRRKHKNNVINTTVAGVGIDLGVKNPVTCSYGTCHVDGKMNNTINVSDKYQYSQTPLATIDDILTSTTDEENKDYENAKLKHLIFGAFDLITYIKTMARGEDWDYEKLLSDNKKVKLLFHEGKKYNNFGEFQKINTTKKLISYLRSLDFGKLTKNTIKSHTPLHNTILRFCKYIIDRQFGKIKDYRKRFFEYNPGCTVYEKYGTENSWLDNCELYKTFLQKYETFGMSDADRKKLRYSKPSLEKYIERCVNNFRYFLCSLIRDVCLDENLDVKPQFVVLEDLSYKMSMNNTRQQNKMIKRLSFSTFKTMLQNVLTPHNILVCTADERYTSKIVRTENEIYLGYRDGCNDYIYYFDKNNNLHKKLSDKEASCEVLHRFFNHHTSLVELDITSFKTTRKEKTKKHTSYESEDEKVFDNKRTKAILYKLYKKDISKIDLSHMIGKKAYVNCGKLISESEYSALLERLKDNVS